MTTEVTPVRCVSWRGHLQFLTCRPNGFMDPLPGWKPSGLVQVQPHIGTQWTSFVWHTWQLYIIALEFRVHGLKAVTQENNDTHSAMFVCLFVCFTFMYFISFITQQQRAVVWSCSLISSLFSRWNILDMQQLHNVIASSSSSSNSTSWQRSIVVRTLVSAGKLSLYCARLLAGWVTTLWLSRPLSVSQHGQLSHPSLRGR